MPDALAAWLAERGEPAYRARQVGDAAVGDGGAGVATAAEIRTLPASAAGALDDAFRLDTLVDDRAPVRPTAA